MLILSWEGARAKALAPFSSPTPQAIALPASERRGEKRHLEYNRAMSKRSIALLILTLLLLAGTTKATMVLAQASAPPYEIAPEHIVQPGETLFSIARRYGTDVETLCRLNAISDPRMIYVGQRLRIAPAADHPDLSRWSLRRVRLGEDAAMLSRLARLPWSTLGAINHLLSPESLLPGMMLYLPPQAEQTHLRLIAPHETRLDVALREGVPFWTVATLNPLPFYTDEIVALPGATEGTTALPTPLRSVELSPQPLVRGDSAIVAVETDGPVADCYLRYLDHLEPCYAQDTTLLFGFLSVSPMLDPATYTVTLELTLSDGGTMALSFPLVVAPGHFSFERIDVPAGRQNLLDAQKIQEEWQRLDALAAMRTEERYWELPFDLPVHAAVSSYFGSRRSYGGAFNSYHSGTDFRAASGTPVRAPADGVVVLAEPLFVRGNSIVLDHGWGVLTGYWHLSEIEVEVGQFVHRGEVIGKVGNTGLSTGAHLHWQMWVSGIPVNALQWTEAFFPIPPLEKQAMAQ